MKTYEELRKDMISTVDSLNLEMGLSNLNAEEEVDEFIAAVRADERKRLYVKEDGAIDIVAVSQLVDVIWQKMTVLDNS